MSFNGSGTFVINTAGQPVVSGTVISSTAFNALTADLANGLSTAITKDGQTTPTANIPMGNNKITALANGTAATDAANLGQVQSTTAKLINSISGADTITGTLSPTLTAYAAGQMFYFVAAGDNTGAVTLNINSLGAKSVTRDGAVALAASDIKSGEVVVVVYDGTQFQVVSQLNSSGDARFANVSIASALNVGGVSTLTGAVNIAGAVSIASSMSVVGVFTATGGSTLNGGVVINEPGADVDFRVESDTDANCLFVDASANNVGIGTSSPTSKLQVSGDIRIADTFSLLMGVGAEQKIFVAGSASNTYLTFNQWTGSAYTERMRLDSFGNLGLGVTPSAWNSAFKSVDVLNASFVGNVNNAQIWANSFFNAGGQSVYKANGAAATLQLNNGAFQFFTASSGTAGNTISFTQAMTLDASGRLGIGETSPTYNLDVKSNGRVRQVATTGTDSAFWQSSNTGGSMYLGLENSTGSLFTTVGYAGVVWHAGNYPIAFGTNNTERARITSGGELLVGTTTNTNNYQCNFQFSGASINGLIVRNNSSTGAPQLLFLFDSAQTVNNTEASSSYEDATAQRWSLRKNGGLANYQSNNVDLSDARTKKDITPVASMWGKIGALEIVTYKYNDQTHDDVNVGVIAQQVEAVEPVWVDNDGWGGETPEDGVPLKTVYTKDITFAAIKALQEAMSRIEALEAKVAALEGK